MTPGDVPSTESRILIHDHLSNKVREWEEGLNLPSLQLEGSCVKLNYDIGSQNKPYAHYWLIIGYRWCKGTIGQATLSNKKSAISGMSLGRLAKI